MRLFIAIELPDDARGHLARLLKDLRESLPRGVIRRLGFEPNPVKWVHDENLHVTLKFLGEVAENEVPALCNSLGSVEVPRPTLLRVGHFECLPPRGPIRVLAAGLDGDVDRLGRVQSGVERVCETFGIPRERRRFLPHLTVGRLRSSLPALARQVVSEIAGRHLPGPGFNAGGFALIQSELLPAGPRYTPVARFPLPPPSPPVGPA